MQSLGMSKPYSSQPKNQNLSQSPKTNRTKSFKKAFPVIYNNTIFMVDPNLLMISSLRFKELVNPYIINNNFRKSICLKINGNEFSNNSMKKFLNICQQIPADIKNSEMEDICKIAKIFQAESVYRKYISIVRKNINPNFIVSTSKYDESKKLIFIESICQSDIDDFVKENNYRENKKDIKLQNEINDKLITYHIKISYHFMKCPLYRFLIDDKVIYTAKRQKNTIFIGDGDEVHINKDKSNHVAKISQEHNRTNFIIANKKKFQLKYDDSEMQNRFSLSVTFPHNDKNLTWKSKESKKHHTLENSKGQEVLVIKKKSYQTIEIETFQSIDPLTIFVIGLSEIVGPHDEPFGGF